MKPFRTLTAVAAPLLRDNVDTDAIIPSREMRSVSKTGLADGLFANWRYRGETGAPDPDFVLNDPRYAGAEILLSGENFGCGSSREHAAWALAEYGFRAVLAPSFNPIFRGNCVSNGIVPVVLDRAAIARLALSQEDVPADHPITVDLQACTVTTSAGDSWPFAVDSEAREMLLTGSDAIEQTMKRSALIQSTRDADRKNRPWIYL